MPDDFSEPSPPDDWLVKIDILTDQIAQLTVSVKEIVKHDNRSNIQTVIHKTNGFDGLVGAAVAVGFCAMIMLLGFMAWAIPNVHDLQAWQQVHNDALSSLKAWRQQQEKMK
jgi:hypothetical protein